jgi:hypothetical protein
MANLYRPGLNVNSPVADAYEMLAVTAGVRAAGTIVLLKRIV